MHFVPQLRLKYSWFLVTFDEAHKLKNSESMTMHYSRDLKSEHRLLLTGTPLQNNVSELWSLLNFMMPHLFKSAEEFDTWFNFDSASNTNAT